jgi:glycosyltransferase involved in cell wall biosynthesis
MKILIVTDAWEPQVNGVVTTFKNTIRELESKGYTVDVISPNDFKTVSLPTYKEIKIAINPWKVSKLIEKSNPDYIHIATEGPLGLVAGYYCRKRGYAFTTSYHTKMPEYVHERFKFVPMDWVYAYMRLIHKGSANVLVTTESMSEELKQHGFKQNIIVWGRGVDTSVFHPEKRFPPLPSDKPVLLYVGRISIEKNLDDFFNISNDCYKIAVGAGPQYAHYKEKYKDNDHIWLVGERKGWELQQTYAFADAFVFPSKTDTFGIVMLESMACGTPVVAYPVTGPKDCVIDGVTGILSNDLESAVSSALKLDRNAVFEIGKTKTWESCTEVFKNSLVLKETK